MGLRGVATNTPDRQSGIAGSNPAGGSSLPTIAFCIGTRPEAIKIWPVLTALAKVQVPVKSLVLASGQHPYLLAQHCAELGVAVTDAFTSTTPGTSQSLTQSFVRCTVGYEHLLEKWRPDLVVVQGDTTTAYAAALVAAQRGLPLAHIEGGVRSHRAHEPFPEELHRRMIGQLARWSFAPSLIAFRNLSREQPLGQVFLTGNTIVGALCAILNRLTVQPESPGRPLVLTTCHRRESRESTRIEVWIETCRALVKAGASVVWPVHPSTADWTDHLRAFGVVACPPMPYATFVRWLCLADVLFTDSGGAVEEAAVLGVPTVEFRAHTDRIEAHEAGIAQMARSMEDPIAVTQQIMAATYRQSTRARSLDPNRMTPYGDGHAGERIAGHLLEALLCPR